MWIFSISRKYFNSPKRKNWHIVDSKKFNKTDRILTLERSIYFNDSKEGYQEIFRPISGRQLDILRDRLDIFYTNQLEEEPIVDDDLLLEKVHEGIKEIVDGNF